MNSFCELPRTAPVATVVEKVSKLHTEANSIVSKYFVA